jgi:hypothetical protein
MLSFGTKINIILFLISVLVGLYLFIMQKEMKMMQQDILDLKMCAKKSAAKCPKNIDACVMEPLVVFDDEEEDEDEVVVSVESNEVKTDDVKTTTVDEESPSDNDINTILKTMDEEEDDEHVVKLSTANKTKKSRSSKTSVPTKN